MVEAMWPGAAFRKRTYIGTNHLPHVLAEKVMYDNQEVEWENVGGFNSIVKVARYWNFCYICSMRRKIIAYGQYYKDFLATLTEKEIQKVKYVLSLLGTEDRLPIKFIRSIRDGLYELRISYNGNIYRIFFIFDEGQIVVLFNCFQKKTQKTPETEIDKALKIKEEYYEYKKQHADWY